MWKLVVIPLLLVLTSQCALGRKCNPDANCKLPRCRCWDDPKAPGGLETSKIPQMVIVSFAYGVNKANVRFYRDLFKGIKNPNGCEPKATFFVAKKYTDFDVVKELHDQGHEIGATSADGHIPKNTTHDWLLEYAATRSAIARAGIPVTEINGTRGANLFVGGDHQFDAMATLNFTYDSTCASHMFMNRSSLIWPYTYDFVVGSPKCDIGTNPTKPHPGIWQFLLADFQVNGTRCAAPSGCKDEMKTSQDAYNLFYNAFEQHYNGRTRAPFILFVDPMWLTVDYQQEGTRQFLQFVRLAFNDTWIVTNKQALAWIQEPVPSSKATSFKPWSC